MIDENATTIRNHQSAADSRVSVTIRDSRNAGPLVLYFSSLAQDARLVGIEIRGADEPKASLDPGKVARAIRNLGLYVEYARACITLDRSQAARSLEMFRNLGRTKRGLPDTFFKLIGEEYEARRRGGEPHLIKAIAEAHHVDKSTASRWVKTARERGYISEPERSPW